jgi:hypothetical protein
VRGHISGNNCLIGLNPSDWVIKWSDGSVDPMSNPEFLKFEKSYDEVTEEQTEEGTAERKEIGGFEVAIKWLKNERKVTRKGWNKGYYYYEDGEIKFIIENYGVVVNSITSDALLADDWELYEKK